MPPDDVVSVFGGWSDDVVNDCCGGSDSTNVGMPPDIVVGDFHGG